MIIRYKENWLNRTSIFRKENIKEELEDLEKKGIKNITLEL